MIFESPSSEAVVNSKALCSLVALASLKTGSTRWSRSKSMKRVLLHEHGFFCGALGVAVLLAGH